MAALAWHGGHWQDGEAPLLGPMDHAFWMASMAFDGARSFDSLAPDLDLHCRRLVRSARALLLEPGLESEEIEGLCRTGIRRFPTGAALYVRPMFFARRGFVVPDPGSTDFALVLHELPMPPERGLAVCFSRFTRPMPEAAPVDAKASCLYPNMQRALAEAQRRGFDNAITFDPWGKVAELATANLWIVRNGRALTPAANGTFLAGITRDRVMQLLRTDGIEADETVLERDDVLAADEIFTTGNYGKVLPITRIEGHDLATGPIYRRARELYWRYARTQPAA